MIVWFDLDSILWEVLLFDIVGHWSPVCLRVTESLEELCLTAIVEMRLVQSELAKLCFRDERVGCIRENHGGCGPSRRFSTSRLCAG